MFVGIRDGVSGWPVTSFPKKILLLLQTNFKFTFIVCYTKKKCKLVLVEV